MHKILGDGNYLFHVLVHQYWLQGPNTDDNQEKRRRKKKRNKKNFDLVLIGNENVSINTTLMWRRLFEKKTKKT